VPHWIERGLYTPGNSVARFHIVWGTGRELALQLIARLQAHPRGEAAASVRPPRRGLHHADGRASAAAAARWRKPAASPSRPSAGSVVVAAGGINGNLEKVRQHWHADWRTPPQ
jgi:predicted oxidoreductase